MKERAVKIYIIDMKMKNVNNKSQITFIIDKNYCCIVIHARLDVMCEINITNLALSIVRIIYVFLRD